MRYIIYKLLIGIVILASLSNVFAQNTPQSAKLFSGSEGYRTWSIGVHAGVLAPVVAIGGYNDFSKWLPTFGYGGYVKKQISYTIGIQAELIRGSLEGNNDNKIAGQTPSDPTKSFHTDLNYVASLNGVFTLGNINWTQLKTAFQPYITVGGGVVNFNPKIVFANGVSFDYKPKGSITQFYVPVGAGVKINLTNRLNLDLGYQMDFVDGDNLDGYYKSPNFNDKFAYGHAGLEFILGDPNKPQLAVHNAPAQLSSDFEAENARLRASLAAAEARFNQQMAQLSNQNNILTNELNGMKVDSDEDGVADYFDKCPGTPIGVKVDGAGCPLPDPPKPIIQNNNYIRQEKYYVTEEDKKVVTEAINNLEFAFGKATIRPSSLPSLKKVADLLIKKGFSLQLSGHTDNVGSAAKNLKLSKDRAQAVKDYLVSQGANATKIEAQGFGKTQPIDYNSTAEGRQRNRRVEFLLN